MSDAREVEAEVSDSSAARAAVAPAQVQTVAPARRPLTPASVLAIQRAAGNAATVQTIQRSTGLVPVSTVATRLRHERRAHRDRPEARAARRRVPTPDEIKALHSGGVVPPDVVEEKIRIALQRMDFDWDLRTGADDVMSKLFPKPGVFDDSRWDEILGRDHMDVYKSVLDAESKLRPDDKKKLEAAAEEAVKLIDKAMADDAGLKEVFGKKAGTAKARYKKAREALKAAIKNSDKAIDTDYNRDDPQVGLGGWANFHSQHMHLTGDVAEVTDLNDTIITLIHEAAHLGHPKVDDLGYYASKGFEAMTEEEKVNNAAHYEELPARELKTSSFVGLTFTPGKTASGAAVSFEDEVRRQASEHLRKAWDRAVDVHQFVRETAKAIIKKPKGNVFATRKKKLLEVSKMLELTIHRQTPKPTTVTTLDAVLSEGVAHAVTRIQRLARKQTVGASGDKAKEVNAVIDGAIKDYGVLLGDAAKDRALIDWLAKGYRKGF